MNSRRHARAALVVALGALISCAGGSSTEPDDTAPASLSLSPDTLRLSFAGDTGSIAATVRNASGSTLSGVAVTFASVDPGVATVNTATGLVTAQGDGATTITAQVAPGGTNLTRSVRVEVGAGLAPAYLVGGYVGTAYTDQVGPATGAGGTFTYGVTAGALPTGLTLSSSTAQITGIPTSSGVYFFQVTAANTALTVSERYAITISTKTSSAFNLWVAYNGGPLPPATARNALNAALARWEDVITGDAGAAVTYSSTAFNSGICQLVDGTLFNGAFIEDVAILMAIDSIDGPNNTLAQAGPCGSFRPQQPVMVSGQMLLDEDDASVATQTYLRDVIWHEIAHVLGVGTFWQDSTVFFGTDSVSYFGKNAKAEWAALGGSGNVPVEPEVGGHWDEAWFNAEIMTPSAEGPLSAHPISKVTIGALLDLGWSAVLGEADAYSLPLCSPACTVPARAEGSARAPDFVIEPLRPLPPQSMHD